MRKTSFQYDSDIKFNLITYGYYTWKGGDITLLFINTDTNVTPHDVTIQYSSSKFLAMPYTP